MNKAQLCRKSTTYETKINQINSPSLQSQLVRPRNVEFSDEISIKDPTINSRVSYESLPYQLSICSPMNHLSHCEQNKNIIPQQIANQKKQEKNPPQLIRPFLTSLDMDFQNTNTAFFTPFCKFIQMQYGFQTITILTIYIYLPLQISLDLVNINYVFIFITILDAVIQLKTQFYAQGKLITDLQMISGYYFTNNLRNDILIIVSFIFLLLVKGNIQWIFVLLIYLGTNSRHQQIIQQFQIYFSTKIPFLISTFFKFVLLLHFLTCFWMSNQNENVLEFEDCIYINSIYFTIGMITMNNTYMPKDTEQIIFLSLTQIIGGFIYVFLIVEIIHLLNQQQKQLEYEYEQGNIKILDFQEILRIASIKGRQSIFQSEIKYSIKRKLLTNCFNTTNLDQLIEICEEIKCQPQEVIVAENQYDDGSIYFIYEGIFSVSIKQCKISQFEQYQQFGEISFYTVFPRTATITSESEGILFKISRQKYLRQVTHNEKELYFLRRDEILFQNQFQMKCFCCSSSQHLIKNCSQLFYYPRITEIPDDHQNHERIMYLRRKKKISDKNHFPVLTQREIKFLNRLIKEEPLVSQDSIYSQEQNCSHTFLDNQEKINIQKIATIDEDKRETLHTMKTEMGQKNNLVLNRLGSAALSVKFQSLTDSDVIISQQLKHSPIHPIQVQKELNNFESQFNFKLFHPEYNIAEVIIKYIIHQPLPL